MKTLAAIIPKFQNFFKTKPISKAWIFGSYARGEETPDSDIDILVDFIPEEKFGLLEYASIIISLEEISGKKVDLVESSSVYPILKPYIEADKILIYERI